MGKILRSRILANFAFESFVFALVFIEHSVFTALTSFFLT
jgi:hypothetical protein